VQSWQYTLQKSLRIAVRGDRYWQSRIDQAISEKTRNSIHLAVFIEPYLTYILQGKKTIESRFSSRKTVPYHRVNDGDILLLKKAGGNIHGICEVSSVWYYNLDPASWRSIKREFSEMLCAEDPAFWRKREKAAFATLMSIKNVTRLPSLKCGKKDRRGWVIFRAKESSQ